VLADFIRLSVTIILAGTGFRTDVKIIDFDYTPYLGKDYKSSQKTAKHVSTYVANHQAWLDIPVLLKLFEPAFAAKASLRTSPVIGILCSVLGCIFIERGAS
jgi:1-acyl-sn-glycerol-3-phosphate acyltransferase